MTISSTASIVTLFGNGATTSWPFAFRIPGAAQLRAAVDPASVDIATGWPANG